MTATNGDFYPCIDMDTIATGGGAVCADDASQASNRYVKRKQNEIDRWTAVRDNLVHIFMQCQQPIQKICINCDKEAQNIIRCADCGPHVALCPECEPIVHAKLLHKPEIWKVL